MVKPQIHLFLNLFRSASRAERSGGATSAGTLPFASGSGTVCTCLLRPVAASVFRGCRFLKRSLSGRAVGRTWGSNARLGVGGLTPPLTLLKSLFASVICFSFPHCATTTGFAMASNCSSWAVFNHSPPTSVFMIPSNDRNVSCQSIFSPAMSTKCADEIVIAAIPKPRDFPIPKLWRSLLLLPQVSAQTIAPNSSGFKLCSLTLKLNFAPSESGMNLVATVSFPMSGCRQIS